MASTRRSARGDPKTPATRLPNASAGPGPTSVQEPAVAEELILKKLPAEIVAECMSCLPTSKDVHTARLVSHAFYHAASPTFGSTFNHKAFTMTAKSLHNLAQLASRPDLAPYIKILAFRTYVPGQYVPLNDLDVQPFPTSFEGGTNYPYRSGPFHQALSKLINVTEIMIVNASTTSPSSYNIDDPFVMTAVWMTLARTKRTHLRRLRTIHTVGAFDLMELPLLSSAELARAQSRACGLRCITSLNITLHNYHHSPAQDDSGKLAKIFRSLPWLTQLTLELPRGWDFDICFQCIARGAASKRLRELYIKNVNLDEGTFFSHWLNMHAATLRNLAITNMTMPGRKWKEFVIFLGNEMLLHTFRLTHDKDMGLTIRCSREDSPTQKQWEFVAKNVSLGFMNQDTIVVRGSAHDDSSEVGYYDFEDDSGEDWDSDEDAEGEEVEDDLFWGGK